MNNLDLTEVSAQQGKHDEIIRSLIKKNNELIHLNDENVQRLKVANVDLNAEFWEWCKQGGVPIQGTNPVPTNSTFG